MTNCTGMETEEIKKTEEIRKNLLDRLSKPVLDRLGEATPFADKVYESGVSNPELRIKAYKEIEACKDDVIRKCERYMHHLDNLRSLREERQGLSSSERECTELKRIWDELDVEDAEVSLAGMECWSRMKLNDTVVNNVVSKRFLMLRGMGAIMDHRGRAGKT